MTTYSPKLKNPNHPDLVQAVRDGDENPIPALCYLLQSGKGYPSWHRQFSEIADIAIGDKPEISFLYKGRLIILSRENGEIMYQVSDY